MVSRVHVGTDSWFQTDRKSGKGRQTQTRDSQSPCGAAAAEAGGRRPRPPGLTTQRRSCERGSPTPRCRWGGSACPAAPASRPETPPRTARRVALRTARGAHLSPARGRREPAPQRGLVAASCPAVLPTPQIQRSCAHGGYTSNHLYSSETKRHLWGSQSPDLAEGPRDFGGAEATSRGRGKSHLQRPKRLARGEVGLQEAPTAPRWATRDPLTSTGIGELRPPKEAQEARPCPDGLGVSEAQPGAEVVGLEPLLPVDRVVPGGVVGAAHPDLGPRGQECRWAQVRGSLSCRRERQDGPLRGRVSDRVAGSGREGGQAVSSPSRGVFPPSAQE